MRSALEWVLEGYYDERCKGHSPWSDIDSSQIKYRIATKFLLDVVHALVLYSDAVHHRITMHIITS